MRDLKKIIRDAGGPKAISGASQETDWPIASKSVYDWPQIGVPDRHWPILIELARATLSELFEANRKARAARPKSSPARAAA